MIRKHCKKIAVRNNNKWTQKLQLKPAMLGINRRSVSRAIFFGVFIALMPIPFQSVLVIGLSFFLKFNVLIAFSLIWLTNPVTMPFILYIQYEIGSFILQTENISDIELTYSWMQDNLEKVFSPLYFGALLMGVICSFLLSYSVDRLWVYSVSKERQVRRNTPVK